MDAASMPAHPSPGGEPVPGTSPWQPGDEARFPYGLPPEEVAARQSRREAAPAENPFAPPAYPVYGAAPEQTPSFEVAGATRLQPRDDEPGSVPQPRGIWVLRFDDGHEVPLRGSLLIGRHPQPRPGEDVELHSVRDESRKVSKTHLLVGLDDAGLFLCDRGSTNGTAIMLADDDFRPCPEGERVRLSDGSKVAFGEHFFQVGRA